MKRSMLVMIALLLATPALGTVTITCTDEGEKVCRIDYAVTGEPAKVRAFALEVTIDAECATVTNVTDFQTGTGNRYGIFPGTIDLTDVENPVWGTPVAPSDDPGAEDTGIGTSTVILEMGSLYDANFAGPDNTGTLCKLLLGNGSGTCHVSISVETTRGGVVLENGTSVGIASTGCDVKLSTYPPCWDFLTQCHGDSNNDGFVDTDDWGTFRDGFYKSYPGAEYVANACGDYNRDGVIDTDDWPEFRDYFYKSPPADCTPGDPCGIFP